MAVKPNNATNPTPKTVKVLMFEVTEPSAEFLFSISNVLLIAGAVAVLIGTIGVAAMGSAKEQFSSERISANEAETAKAQEGAAIANREAKQAQLELERLKAPRLLTEAQLAHITDAVKPYSGQQFSGMLAPSVPDARPLWAQIAGALQKGGWVLRPSWGLSNGNPEAGVAVMPNEGVLIHIPSGDLPASAPMANALWFALAAAGIKGGQNADAGAQARSKIIVIEVGTKPL